MNSKHVPAQSGTPEQAFLAIPQELRERQQWVLYRLGQRTDKKTGKTSLTKVPYQARHPQRHAASDNPQTWAPFSLAVKALQTGQFDGIGYVFSKDDPYAGIDLDHCIDEQDQIAAWARAHIDTLASYAELSPSLRGVHIIVKATLPGGGLKRDDLDIELYDQGRYFTMTGKALAGAASTIESRQEEVARLYVALTTRPRKRQQEEASGHDTSTPLDLDDRELLARALKNSAFAALWRGDMSEYNHNASVADFALCCRLAFWTGKDKDRIDRLFRQSALLRDKWNEQHASDGRTYGALTIDKACEVTEETYKPQHTKARPRNEQRQGGQPRTPDAAPGAEKTREHPAYESPYQETPNGLVWRRVFQEGERLIPLTTFTARIVSDVSEDDGAEIRRRYELQARLGDRAFPAFAVPAEKFAAMNWPSEHLGARAMVFPGNSMKDHARAAIQLLSDDIAERRIFAHTGWRQLPTGWAYLHGGGAIGATGALAGVEVTLPNRLSSYVLPDPPEGAPLVTALQASMALLDGLGPDAVVFPVYAAIWRAAIEAADVNLHLVGASGGFKSELAGLAQAHWGAKMNGRNLPASWMSTGNAIEGLAFWAKDALLVIDDFCPTGTTSDVQKLHATADRVFRGQGNHAGRQRMRADSSLQPDKPPRGLILSTGEDTPRGQSVRARVLLLEVAAEGTPGAINAKRLTCCQEAAGTGLYAQALAGFVHWVAPHYEQHRQWLRNEALNLRAQATQSGHHRRTPDIIAQLGAGFRLFLTYAQESKALTASEAQQLWARGWKALGEAAAMQQGHQADYEATGRFLKLLNAALASKRVHVANLAGREPENDQVAWGWRWEERGESGEWRPAGHRIGWIDGDDLYLEPEAAYKAAQDIGQGTGDPLHMTSRILHKRLSEKGILKSVEENRQTLTIRKRVEGRDMKVLHLDAKILCPPDKPDNPPDKTHPFRMEAQEEAPEQDTAEVTPEKERSPQNSSDPILSELAGLSEKKLGGREETRAGTSEMAPATLSSFTSLYPEKNLTNLPTTAETLQETFGISTAIKKQIRPAIDGTSALDVATILTAPDLTESGKLRAIAVLAEPTLAQEALDERRIEVLEWASQQHWAEFPWHGQRLGGSEENWWLAVYEVLRPSQIILLAEEIGQRPESASHDLIAALPIDQRLMYRASQANYPSLQGEHDIIPQGTKAWTRYINEHEHNELLLLKLEQAFISKYGDCLKCDRAR